MTVNWINTRQVAKCLISSLDRTFSSATRRPDPLARRPNQKCDPYGQGGKPLGWNDAKQLLEILDKDWILEGGDGEGPPVSLTRSYLHKDYLTATAFLSKIAVVGDLNNHYPTIVLERKLQRQSWQVTTTIKCHTITLNGLSRHDFHIAMLMDVEAGRPEAKRYIMNTAEDISE
jgi:pterin-4a-carbinolamine dehydratase